MENDTTAAFEQKRSLRAKFFYLTTVLIVVLGLGLGGYSVWKLSQVQLADFENQGLSLARGAARTGRFQVFTEDLPNLRDLVETVKEERDVLFVTVSRADGTVLLSTDPAFEALGRELLKREGGAKEALLERRTVGKEEFYNILAPVHLVRQVTPTVEDESEFLDFGEEATGFAEAPPEGPEAAAPPPVPPAPAPAPTRRELVGYVNLGLSLENVMANIHRTVGIYVGLTLLIILGASFVTSFFARRITQPIEGMVKIAVSIAQGDYSRPVGAVQANDEVGVLATAFRQMQVNLSSIAEQALEIAHGDLSKEVKQEGTLAEAFNRMLVGLRESRAEIEAYNRELEQRVAERTEELRKTNEDLQSTNQLLEEAKNALWGEMELATKIQTALLPNRLAAGGYDLAAAMVTADEVGGDYYDFVEARDGRLWFAIGDVAGHGVNAGLVMMMTQCILNTLIERNPTLEPKEVITYLNRVLYGNICERMGNDDYMTLSVLVANGTGEFTFSGAHEDMLVYRRRTGACEWVPTQGAWIGVFPDISHSTENSQLRLDPGDVLLLYTDGIIEAKNGDGEQYDVDRLGEVVATHADRPASRLQEEILASVRQWMVEQKDDITLMLIKRKD